MTRTLAALAVVLAMLLAGCSEPESEPGIRATESQPAENASEALGQGQDATAGVEPLESAEEPEAQEAEQEAPESQEPEDPTAAAFRKATIESRGEKWLDKFDDVSAGWSQSKITEALGTPSTTYMMRVPSAFGPSEEVACLAYVVGKASGGGERWKFVNVDPTTKLFYSKGNMEGTIRVSGGTTHFDASVSGIEY